ncbi:MAG: hypothetical protein ABR975_04305 [Vulcanimicrobiaceae bacterium]
MESTVTAVEDERVLAARVERLERRARMDRAFALGALALTLATAQASTPPLTVAGSGTTASIRADGLHVAVGGTPQFAAVLGSAGPTVDEMQSNGALRQSLFLVQETGVLRQFTAGGKRALGIEVALDGTPLVRLYGPDGVSSRLGFEIDTSKRPVLRVNSTTGTLMAMMATDDDGPYMIMKDASGATRSYIGQYNDLSFGLDVRNASDVRLFKRP